MMRLAPVWMMSRFLPGAREGDDYDGEACVRVVGKVKAGSISIPL